jgi:guanylate kinase
LRELRPDIHIPVSLTTRQPRQGEADGVSYHFVSTRRFQEMVDAGELLEHAVVHGTHSYGTPREDVASAIASGQDVILEIDLQGARQVKSNLPEAKLVFLAPPSWSELVRRLEGRGTEDAAQVERRLRTARLELEAQAEADFVVVNDHIENTVQALIVLMGL